GDHAQVVGLAANVEGGTKPGVSGAEHAQAAQGQRGIGDFVREDMDDAAHRAAAVEDAAGAAHNFHAANSPGVNGVQVLVRACTTSGLVESDSVDVNQVVGSDHAPDGDSATAAVGGLNGDAGQFVGDGRKFGRAGGK